MTNPYFLIGRVLLVSLPQLSEKEEDWLLPAILMKFYHSFPRLDPGFESTSNSCLRSKKTPLAPRYIELLLVRTSTTL